MHRRLHTILFFTICFCYPSLTCGHSRTDSLIAIINLGLADTNTVNAYAGLCREYGCCNFAKALSSGQQGLQLSGKMGYCRGAAKCLINIGCIYFSLGNCRKACEYIKYFENTTDSLYLIASAKQIKEIEARYQTEKKEKEITLLQKEKEIIVLEAGRQKNLKYVFVVSGIALLIFSFFLINSNRVKKRTNIKLEEQGVALKSLNRELQSTIATKDRFFSILSHDLKNPVLAIETCSKLMNDSENYLTKEEKQSLVREQYSASKRVSALLENLLLWAKCQQGEIIPRCEKINLCGIIEEEISLLKLNLENKNIFFGSLISPENTVIADRNMLGAVIRNLVSNAIKFTGNGGKIVIDSAVSGSAITVEVKDTGVGMKVEDISRLFNAGAHFSRAGTESEKGSGLGLLICYGFITAMGGEIWAESEMGKGTSFKFTLPL